MEEKLEVADQKLDDADQKLEMADQKITATNKTPDAMRGRLVDAAPKHTLPPRKIPHIMIMRFPNREHKMKYYMLYTARTQQCNINVSIKRLIAQDAKLVTRRIVLDIEYANSVTAWMLHEAFKAEFYEMIDRQPGNPNWFRPRGEISMEDCVATIRDIVARRSAEPDAPCDYLDEMA